MHGEVIKPADLPALTRGQGEGLATYRLLGEDAELVTLDAIPAGKGRSWSGWGQKCPADEKYPNCVSDLPYLRDKDSLPTDSVQFALTETHSLILDTNRGLPGISSPANYYTGCGVKNGKLKSEIP